MARSDFFLRERRADRDPPSAYFVSEFKQETSGESLLLETAPGWDVERWVQPPDATANDVTDFRGRIVCLFFIRSSCRGSRSHALPALAHVARHFQGDSDVAVVALQTPVGDRRLDTAEDLERVAKQVGGGMQIGQCRREEGLPAVVRNYLARGTPWTVIIDRDGIVQFSNYTVRPEEIIRRIEELQ